MTKGFFFCFLFLFTPERGIFEVELFEIVLAVSEEVSNEEETSPLGAEDHVPMHDKSANRMYKIKDLRFFRENDAKNCDDLYLRV